MIVPARGLNSLIRGGIADEKTSRDSSLGLGGFVFDSAVVPRPIGGCLKTLRKAQWHLHHYSCGERTEPLCWHWRRYLAIAIVGYGFEEIASAWTATEGNRSFNWVEN